ncbi:MAG: hypothetical protein ACLFRT_08275 [Actinomycetota bacterium]
MQFKGQLLLPDEPGPGLRVHLDVAEHHLAVESDGGGLGAWPLETVDVERLQGDIFALTVAGEPLQFVADDTIGFAYSGVPAIEKFSSRRPRARSTLRSMFDRIWNGPDDAASPTPVEKQTPVDDPEAVEELAVLEEAEAVEKPDRPGLLERIFPSDPESEMTSGRANDIDEMIAGADVVLEPTEDSPAVPEPSPLVEPVEETTPTGGRVDDDGGETAVCPGTTNDGRPCESQILTSSGYCYAHDPKRAFEDRYQAALEAREQLKRDATERLNRIYSRLDKAMRQVERGELDPETAMAMAQLANTMCAILGIDEPSTGDDYR